MADFVIDIEPNVAPVPATPPPQWTGFVAPQLAPPVASTVEETPRPQWTGFVAPQLAPPVASTVGEIPRPQWTGYPPAPMAPPVGPPMAPPAEKNTRLNYRFNKTNNGPLMAHLYRTAKNVTRGTGEYYLNFNVSTDGKGFLKAIVQNWMGFGLSPDEMEEVADFIKETIRNIPPQVVTYNPMAYNNNNNNMYTR